MPNRKFSAFTDGLTNQSPTDTLVGLDVSLPAAAQNSYWTLNNLFSNPTRNITDKAMRWNAPGAAPSLSASGEASLYYDGSAFLVSYNGSAYTGLGGVSGSGAVNRLALWNSASVLFSDSDLSYSLDSLNAPNLSVLESFRGLELSRISALSNGGSPGSGNVRVGDVSATIVSDGAHNAFPGLAQLPDGRLLAVYRVGASHGSPDGVLKYNISSDQGRTWSSATLIYTPTSPPDARDPEIALLRNGTLLVTFFDYSTSGRTYPKTISGTIAANGAITWSLPRDIANPFITTGSGSGGFVSSKPLELPSGVILLPIYGKLSALDTYMSAIVVKSTDGGVTWGSPVTVATAPSTIDYNESNIVRFPGGRLVMITRADIGLEGYARSVSNDDGVTWSAISTVITLTSQAGRPALHILGSGGLLLFTRKSVPNSTGFATSWDEGVTWTAFDSSLSPSGTDYMTYASMAAQSGGSVATVFAEEQLGGARSDLYYRELYDGYGLFGGGTVEAKILRSAGIITSAGNVGVKDASPAYDLTLGGTASRTLSVGRAADNTAGSDFTVRAGGGASAWNNRAGGSLYLNSGISTGSGAAGNTYFQSYPAGSSGSSDNSAVTQMTLLGATGRLGIGISPTAKLHLQPDAADIVGAQIKAFSGQTAPLLRIDNASGVIQTYFDYGGRLGIGTSAVPGTVNGVADTSVLLNLQLSGSAGAEIRGTSSARLFFTATSGTTNQKVYECLTDGESFKLSRLDDTISTRTTYLTVADGGTLSVRGGLIMSGPPQSLVGAGAVNLTTYSTLLVTTGANALTLAAGSEGQFKFIRMNTDGGDGILTVTNGQGFTTITFNAVGNFVYLFYQDAKWHILTNSGCVVA